jgi:hypothetical protein
VVWLSTHNLKNQKFFCCRWRDHRSLFHVASSFETRVFRTVNSAGS